MRRASADAVPWLAAALAVGVVALTVATQRALAAGGAPGATAPPGTSATAMGADQRVLVRWLVAAAVLEAAVATALDFRFGAAMKARFTGDDLVTAVSLFYGGSHLLLLALQVTLVPRLLTSRALPVTVSIHPLAAAVGAGALALVPGFGAIAFVRTGEWVLRAATSRTGQELSLSALPPVPRARWKVLLRGAATPLGAALAGGVLYLTSARAVTEPVAFAAILAGVILVWLVVVRRAARSFLAAMAAPLGMRGVALRGRQHTAFDLDAWIRLVAATGLPEPRAAELARAAMARSGGAADEITPYLADEDPAVRRALYELAARRPRPAAVRELHVAAQIEDDPEALAAALDALAAHGARAAIEALAGRDLDDPAVTRALAAARVEVGLAADADRDEAAATLCAHHGAWAARLVGLAAGPAYDAAVAAALAAGGEARRHGLRAAVAGGESSVTALLAALRAGDRDAALALADLDPDDAGPLRARLPALRPGARAAIARARASALAPGEMLLELAADPDDEVRAAALRTLVGHARGGFAPPVTAAAAAMERERAALVALCAARPGAAATPLPAATAPSLPATAAPPLPAAAATPLPATAAPSLPATAAPSLPATAPPLHAAVAPPLPAAVAPPLHAAEVERAVRRALGRLVHAVALATAAAGRDPVAALAAGRRVVDAPEAARRRALDVLQELAAAPLPVLDAIEGALRPPPARADRAATAAAATTVDPWLGALLRGEHAAAEPALAGLRACRFFERLAGRHAAELAVAAGRRTLAAGERLVEAGEPGREMFVVLAGRLRLAGADAPAMTAGSVVGELALVDDAPRAATVIADEPTEVMVVERAAFAAALDRWPELGLALLRTLAAR